MNYIQPGKYIFYILLTFGFCIYGQPLSKRQVLDQAGKLVLLWQNEADGTITMELQGKTPGYVGLGISPSGTMVDADTVIGWVKNGKPFIQDGYSADRKRPTIDASQDYKLVSGSEDASQTTIRFNRKLKTGDPEDKDITTGPMTFIWAYHDVDPEVNTLVPYHGNVTRGSAVVTLIRA